MVEAALGGGRSVVGVVDSSSRIASVGKGWRRMLVLVLVLSTRSHFTVSFFRMGVRLATASASAPSFGSFLHGKRRVLRG